MSETRAPNPLRLRTVALPAEHGGWSFVLEPIALGLLVAPSLPGVYLAVAVFAAFLLRHPLKLAASDWRRGRRYARTRLAARFVLLYSAFLIAGIAATFATAGAGAFIPLLRAAPLILVQLAYDASNRSRHWIPEVAGPTALAAASASIALAGGWTLTAALPLWVIMAARAMPTVLYVRVRLRLEKGQSYTPAPVMIAHLAAVGVGLALAAARLAPILATVAFVILLLRAAYGLSSRRKPALAKVIGLQELAFGVMTILLVYAGYAFDF